ncbi:MAG: AhpC/TSA antioxidant enzyme [Solirubrobacteraceae bacterium]|nr:AhpC/TSA antioxidant enzyme [Solirubrobacteraceae bacterium]
MQLHRARGDFEEAGARLAAIGQGTPRHAEHFVEEYDLDGMQVLVDPARKTYELAGAKIATVDELWHPKIVARATKIAATDRLIQGKTQGHNAQLGGVLVVARDGEIAYAHMADDASDNPPTEEVLKAARAAADKG